MFNSNLMEDYNHALQKELSRQFDDHLKARLTALFAKHGIRYPRLDSLEWLVDTEYSIKCDVFDIQTMFSGCPHFMIKIELWKKDKKVGWDAFKVRVAGSRVIELED